MSNKPSIRIVKREERHRVGEIADASQTINSPARDATHKMARTVTGWVREFKKRTK